MSVFYSCDESEPMLPYMVSIKPIVKDNRFTLPLDLENTIRNHGFKFGFGPLSDFVFNRTYARDTDTGKETFPDVVIRVINGILSIRKNHCINNGLHWNDTEWYEFAIENGILMMELKTLPSGRGLYVCGTEFGYNKGSCAFNNCAFVSTANGILHSSTQMMDLLMNGCGVGFDTEFTKDSQLSLPGCLDCRFNYLNRNCNCNIDCYKVHDSREGWVKSLYLLIKSYSSNSRCVHFDYSDLREKGEKIKGFGGVSSGSEPLKTMHFRIRNYFECYFDSKKNAFDGILNLCKRDPSLEYCISSIEDMKSRFIKLNRAIKALRDKYSKEMFLSEESRFFLNELVKEQNTINKTYRLPRLISDIFNTIGICIVSGNIRRSSEISLGNTNDEEFLNLKNYTLNPERESIGWMSNNTIVMKKESDFLAIPQIMERVKVNGEPGILNYVNMQKFGRIGKKHPIGREAEPDNAVGLNPCVTGDTLILTTDGLKSVSRLVGKKFTAIVNGVSNPSTDAGFWSNGVKKTFKLTLENGLTIKATDNHQIKTIEGWVEMKHLTVDSTVCVSNNTGFNHIELKNEILDLVKFFENPPGDYYTISMDYFFQANYNREYLEKLQILLNSAGIESEITGNTLSVGKLAIDALKYADLSTGEPSTMNSPYLSKVLSVIELRDEEVFDCCIPDIHCFTANGIIAHNCGEINLEDGELCNLFEVFISKCETYDETIKAIKFATFYTSTVALLPSHWANTNAVIARNRRIGVSLSGVADFYDKIGSTELTRVLKNLYRVVREENLALANLAGVPPSIRVTTIKPSGTISLLAGTSAGMHWPEFEYYIRRVRVASNSELVPILKNANIPWEFDEDSGPTTTIFSFPIFQGNTRTADKISAWEQASVQVMLQREYSDNGVSFTMKFNRKTEGEILSNISALIMPSIKGFSCLPHDEEVIYKQAPYERITKEQFEEMNSHIKDIDWTTFTEKTEIPRGCDGDRCTRL
jgi:ribonucleotide reductase alpha subunit